MKIMVALEAMMIDYSKVLAALAKEAKTDTLFNTYVISALDFYSRFVIKEGGAFGENGIISKHTWLHYANKCIKATTK
jgi:hypothetical protein